MTNSTMGRLMLGLLTLLQLVYAAWFTWSVFSAIRGTGGLAFVDDQTLVMHVAMMALNFALMVFYIVHLFRKTTLGTEMKILWLLLLFFVSTPTMIVYWYLYIWRDQSRPRPTVVA